MLYEIRKQALPNGETIAYREAGEEIKQPTLILIHGNQSSSLFFEFLMRRFESKANIYAVDLAGFGYSTYNNPHETLKDWADDVALFMDEMHISSAVVLGWSAGGGIAMELAAGYPEKVQHLIPMASVGVKGLKMPKKDLELNPVAGSYLVRREEITLDPYIIAVNAAFLAKNDKFFHTVWEQRIFDLNTPEDSVFDAYMQEILKERCFLDMSVALCQFNITQEADLVEGSGRISDIKCPVTWIHGRQDQSVPFETGAASVTYFKCPAELKPVDDAGHAVFMDQPKVFAEILGEIIQK